MAKPFYAENMLTGERTLAGFAGRGAKSRMKKVLRIFPSALKTKKGEFIPKLARTPDIWREGPRKGKRTVVWGVEWRRK